MLKKFLYRTLILTAFLMAAFFSVRAEDNDGQSDEVDGIISTVGQNNRSGIDVFRLNDSNGDQVATDGGDLQPVNEVYTFYLEFTELDGISDIHKITFKLFDQNFPDVRRSFDFHTKSGVLEFEEETDRQLLADNALVIEWTEEGGFDLIPINNQITWELVGSSFEQTTGTTFVLEADFRISKVAKHNTAWYAGVLINDGKNSDLFEERFQSIGDFDMNWYGEIQVPSDSIVRWTEVDPGSNFNENVSHITNRDSGQRAEITYISNGYYQQLIRSSSEWTATVPELPVVGHNKAFLTTKSSVNSFSPQEFGIDVTFEYDNVENGLRNTPSLNPTRVDVVSTPFRNHMFEWDRFNDTIWRSRTLETGDKFSNFELRVSVAESFQNATYEGILTMIISNDSLNFMEETDYDSFVSTSPSSILSSQVAIGVFADNESQLLKYLSDTHLQVPIYLRNGFIEITTTTAIQANGDATLKPIIGDLFVASDDATVSNVAIIYGDLYLHGSNATLNNVVLKTHFGEGRVQTGNLQPQYISSDPQTLNAATDSPAGNLIIESGSVTASNVTIDGSLYVLDGSIATVNSTDSTTYKINHNVFVSDQSKLTISNYTINNGVNGSDSTKTPSEGYGDIRLTTSSVIVLGDKVQFRDLYLLNSTGTSLSSANNTDGFAMTLDENSSFIWNEGDLYEAEIRYSDLTFSGGEIFRTLEVINASVEVASGHVGSRYDNELSGPRTSNFNLVYKGDQDVWNYGMIIDEPTQSYSSPSNVTISGGTVENLKSANQASILVSGSSAKINTFMQTEDTVSVVFNDGEINKMRMYDASTLSMHGGQVSKLYTLDTSDVYADGGAFNNANSTREFLSINDYSTVLITGSASITLSDIDLSSNTTRHNRGKEDQLNNTISITDNTDYNGMLIRDDAVVTISATTTFNTSTDLELRDNATLNLLKTGEVFDQIYFDYSAHLNEPGSAFSSIRSMASSIIDIYVVSSNGGTRATRNGGDSIAYDFNKIEGDNSAFSKARDLYDTHGVSVTVYLASGSFDNEDLDTTSINLDRPELWLMYSTDERTQTRSSGSTSFLSLTSAQAGSHAIVDIPVIISNDDNRVDGIYFDLDSQSILISSSAVFPKFFNNDVHQDGGTTPILESYADGFNIDSNYFTRTDQTNNSVGILLEGPFRAPSGSTTYVRFNDNYVNNIQNDAVLVKDATTSTFVIINDNFIGTSTRTVKGHGLKFLNVDFEGLDVDFNRISYTSNSAILFVNASLDGNIDIDKNIISNVDSGHGIHFDGTTFGTFTQTMSLNQNTIQAFDSASHGIFFDSINAIDNITFSGNDIQTAETAVLISSSGSIANITFTGEDYFDLRHNGIHLIGTTLSDMDVTRGTYRDISATAVKLEFSDSIDDLSVNNGIYERIGESVYNLNATNTVNDVQFTENRSVSNGHRILDDNVNDGGITSTTLRTMSEISQSAIKISSVTLAGFELNGFIIDRFALEGDAYAGLDINVTNMTNFEVNQALRKVTRHIGSSVYVFDRYDVIDVVFSDGLGPAINFNLSSSGVYDNNLLFNPNIQENLIGIQFSNGPSDPLASVFNTSASFVLNGSQADMEALIASQDNSLTSKIANFDTNIPAGIAASGVKNNVIDIIDATNSIDFNAFRITYDNLAYDTIADTLFIVTLDGDTQLRRSGELVSQSTIQVFDAIDRLSLNPTNTGIVAEIETSFLLDDSDTSVLGVAKDDLNRVNGELTIQFDAPGSYSGTAYIETEGNTTIVTQSTIDRSGNSVSIRIPVATTNGSVWNPVSADTVYRIIIDWRDGSNNFVTYSAFMVDFDRSGESRFIDAINNASTGSEIEGLLEDSQKNAFDASVSTQAAFDNLFNNIDTNQFTTDTSFNTLLDDLVIYEKALVDALTEANSIATNVAIQSVLIQDVIDAVSGTSIERVDDGKSATNESAAAFASRLDNLLNVSIPAIEEERWVLEEIEAQTFSSFSDFETKLESILNGLSGRTVFDPASLTISPSALLVTTNTSISIIEAYFNSTSGTYPLYDDGSVVETLSPVGTWILVNPSGSSWETANDAVGSFGFERVFSFPDGSNQFFDSDRNTTTEVAVIVSTIRISDGFDDVILTKDTATNNATLDIAFTVADDDTTIAGADKDSVDTKNGLLEFSVAAPSGYDNAVISTTINGTLNTQSGIKVGDEFTFDLPIANSSGSDWVSLTNGAIFSIIIEFYDGTDGPYLPHALNLEIDRSNEERLMSSINAATTTDSLINLLDSARKNSVDSSSIGNSIIYNSLLANLNANSSNGTEINSLTAFDTLLSAIIAFEETLEDAVDYESSLSRTTSFTSDFYTKLIDNITSALISTDIRRVYGNTTDASVLISDLETLKTNLESIEVSQWIIEELKDNHTPSTYPEIVTALKAVYVTLKDASIYTPSNIVLSPSSIMIAPGTIEADVRTLLNTDANYPQYSESGNTFTLDEITGEDWNLVEIDNNSAGSYTYQRVFKLPPDSDFFANSDRDLEVTVTAIVSTVTTEPLISEVTGQKRADANVFDFDLTFLVDDSDSKTIRGSAVDRVELDNGELTLIVAAPSSAASARVNITFRNKSPITNASYSLSGNAIYIAIEYANKDGSVWKLPSSNETYDLSVQWLDGSNNILMTQSLSGTLSQNTTPFIDELNDASNGSSLKALLEENFVNQVSSSSITESAFYDLLIDNLDTDQFDTYASFNTLLVELLNFEETSLASVNYANNLSGSDSSFDNTLVGDVLNALDGTSIEKVYSGGTVDASTLITRLNSLNTTLSSINPSTWVIEDIISTQAYDDFETLESRLLTIAEALEGKVIYDSDNLKISPSALTVVTGTELQVVIDALNEELNNYPRYEETGFTDVILSQVSNWVFTRPGFTWDDVKNTPSIETFEATYEFPESSRLYFDVSRTREITITVEVTIE